MLWPSSVRRYSTCGGTSGENLALHDSISRHLMQALGKHLLADAGNAYAAAHCIFHLDATAVHA